MNFMPTQIRSYCFLVAMVLASCSSKITHDFQEQPLIVSFQFTWFGQYDSNTGVFEKELGTGVAVAHFFLTRAEQMEILGTLDRMHFFEFPDTLSSRPFRENSRALEPFFLFVNDGNRSKLVVWQSPPDSEHGRIYDIEQVIKDIIAAKPEFKELPPSNLQIKL